MLNYFRTQHQVMKEAKLPRTKLDKLIHQRLRDVLISAYSHVPYYRELMKSVGYDPSRDYRGPEDLSKLPITTKKNLKQREITEFVAENRDISKCLSDMTAGSTGIPLTIYQSSYERAIQIAKFLRVFFIHGYSLRHTVMSLSRPDRYEKERSFVQRFGILRRKTVNYLQHSIPEMTDILLKYKPDTLYGNRTHYELIARELRHRGIQLDNIKLIVGTGEAIHDTTRRLCLKQYGAYPVETYGSIEMGIMAYETPARDGLHLYENLIYFEFLDNEGRPVPPGVSGRVVVTDLIGKCMPFIRYDQGDFAVFEQRNDINGNAQRRLTQTIGRENEHAQIGRAHV